MTFSGRSIGGGMGGGGGGRLLRTFGRTVARVGNGAQDPYFSSSTAVASPSSNRRRPNSLTCLSISSPVNSHSVNSVTGLPFQCSYPEFDDWITVDGFVDEGFNEFSCSCVTDNVQSPGSGFCVSDNDQSPVSGSGGSGHVQSPGFNDFSGSYFWGNCPSDEEVGNAVTSLLHVFGSNSHCQPNYDNSGSEMDWREPSMDPYDTRMRQHSPYADVYHAFNLLENDQSVQKMVKSMSCDKSIWDAVLKNKALLELKEQSSASDVDKAPRASDGTPNGRGPHATRNVMIWMFNSSRVKFMELIERITEIITALFQTKDHNKDEKAEFSDAFAEKVRISFMLTIIVFLVVVVGRAARV